jgi:hypothetical protein
MPATAWCPSTAPPRKLHPGAGGVCVLVFLLTESLSRVKLLRSKAVGWGHRPSGLFGRQFLGAEHSCYDLLGPATRLMEMPQSIHAPKTMDPKADHMLKKLRISIFLGSCLWVLGACNSARQDLSGRPTEDQIRQQLEAVSPGGIDDVILVRKERILFVEGRLLAPVTASQFQEVAEINGWIAIPENERFSSGSDKYAKDRLCLRYVKLNDLPQVSVVWSANMRSEDYCNEKQASE